MPIKWKRELLLLAIVSLGAVIAVGCSVSNGADYQPTSTQSRAEPTAEAKSSPTMTGMDMPSGPEKKPVAKNSVANQVVIENFSFVPAMLTVKAGTKVTWVNRDDVPHTATDNDHRFNSKTLDTDDQFSFTFSQPGTYDYYCALHPKMIGKIIVK